MYCLVRICFALLGYVPDFDKSSTIGILISKLDRDFAHRKSSSITAGNVELNSNAYLSRMGLVRLYKKYASELVSVRQHAFRLRYNICSAVIKPSNEAIYCQGCNAGGASQARCHH